MHTSSKLVGKGHEFIFPLSSARECQRTFSDNVTEPYENIRYTHEMKVKVDVCTRPVILIIQRKRPEAGTLRKGGPVSCARLVRAC